MATATYVPIATTTLGASTSTISFSSIPGTYTDLKLILNLKATSGSTNSFVYIQFNSDTATNYSNTTLRGNGSTASSTSVTSQTQIAPAVNALSQTIPSFIELDIFNYAGSTFKSTLSKLSDDLNGSGNSMVEVGMWRSTSAITTVSVVTTTAGTYDVGSSATLYGILKA